MVPSTNSSFPTPNWKMVSLAINQNTWVYNDGLSHLNLIFSSLTFSFNHNYTGNGHWDHRSDGGNFQVTSPGIYYTKAGILTTVAQFPKACANNCSGNGVCETSTYSCQCYSGYFGGDCSGECPGGHKNPCFGRGKCDDGSNGDGQCKLFFFFLHFFELNTNLIFKVNVIHHMVHVLRIKFVR